MKMRQGATSPLDPKSWCLPAAFLCSLWLIPISTYAAILALPSHLKTPYAQPKINAAFSAMPLIFEPNLGQTDPEVLFFSRNKGFVFFLTAREAVLTFRNSEKNGVTALKRPESLLNGLWPWNRKEPPIAAKDVVLRIKWNGAKAEVKGSGLEQLPGKSNYFRGNDSSKWVTNVKQYGRVKLSEIYPGIDLTYYDRNGKLEFDWEVHPGSNPDQIEMEMEGMQGCHIDGNGNIKIEITAGQELTLKAPEVYQETSGHRTAVKANYKLTEKNRVYIQLGAYDLSKKLVIDPVIVYSTYLGGSSFDFCQGIAIDSGGNAYVTGRAGSIDFPTTVGAFKTTLDGGSYDGFIAKLNSTGNGLVYSTYIGTTPGTEVRGYGIAVDSSGNAYVTGYTNNDSFPTTPGAFQTTYNCCGIDAFVTKLNSTGNGLVYSTYLGGIYSDFGAGIAVDAGGNAYVTGQTYSSNFPTTPGAFQTTFGGGCCYSNAFVTKLNTAGSALVYSTYLGGSNNDQGTGISVDSSGNAYVAGIAASNNFPTTPGSYQPSLGGGNSDAFVTKLNSAGSGLVYSTYLGGGGAPGYGNELCYGIAVDISGNAYVTGQTSSANFPTTAGACQTTFSVIAAAFVTKLNSAGNGLAYSTFFGGDNQAVGYGIAVDISGNAYVIGICGSGFPNTAGADQVTYGGGLSDAFVAKLNGVGNYVYSTYLGGGSDDQATGIVVDGSGNAYVSGWTYSPNFPTTVGAYQISSGGTPDGFLCKFSLGSISGTSTCPTPVQTPTVTSTISDTLTPTDTATITPSATPTASPTITSTDSPMNTVTITPTKTSTATSTTTAQSSPTDTSTATSTETLTPSGSEPPHILAVLAVPNPLTTSQGKLGVQLQGNANRFEVKIYSPGYTLIDLVKFDLVAGPGWTYLPLDVSRLANGLKYVVVSAHGQGKSSKGMSKLFILR